LDAPTIGPFPEVMGPSIVTAASTSTAGGRGDPMVVDASGAVVVVASVVLGEPVVDGAALVVDASVVVGACVVLVSVSSPLQAVRARQAIASKAAVRLTPALLPVRPRGHS
jgi:hypothetical protein